ncbi:MAG: hypothetical protein JSV22_02305 [Bacteroidales bacterium]|nr:MAG: hypothetical protein JSV22_02305 [Bacteroidales bacterium]
MSEQSKPTGQGLGIAGLILGILAIPLAIIPCTFIAALLFGIAGIVLSSIALSQANKAGASKGLIIAALVCSILGTTIASLWGATIGKESKIFRKIIKEEFKEEFGREFEKAFKDFGDDMEEALEDLEEELEKEFDEDFTKDHEEDLEDTLRKIEEEID